MDVPVLLKRSARYFVVERGFVFLILAVSVGLTFGFGQAFSRHFSAGSSPVEASNGPIVAYAGNHSLYRWIRNASCRSSVLAMDNCKGAFVEDAGLRRLNAFRGAPSAATTTTSLTLALAVWAGCGGHLGKRNVSRVADG